MAQVQDRNRPQIARGEFGSCELPGAAWPGPGSVRQQRAAEACLAAARARTHRLRTQARAAARTGLAESGVFTGRAWILVQSLGTAPPAGHRWPPAGRRRWGRRKRRHSGSGGAAGARAMSAARATSTARVIMHVGSPDAARAQDVVSRWSRLARSLCRACRDGRSHRGRGAHPHDRARRDKHDGRREPRGRRGRLMLRGGGDRWAKSWQPSSLSAISSVFLSNSLYPLSLPTFSLSLSSLCLSLFLTPSLILSLPFSLSLSFSLLSFFSPLSLSPLLLSVSSLSGEGKERGRECVRE